MSDDLTADDLARITGSKRRDAQAKVLDRAGIYYWRALDGRIVTTWHHVHHPHTGPGMQEPDIEAWRREPA